MKIESQLDKGDYLELFVLHSGRLMITVNKASNGDRRNDESSIILENNADLQKLIETLQFFQIWGRIE